MPQFQIDQNVPTDEEVNAQIDRLRKRLRSPKQSLALSVLLEVSRNERSRTDGKAPLKNSQLFTKIYDREIEKWPEDKIEAFNKKDLRELVAVRIRKTLNDLSKHLHRYYTTEPGTHDDVVIEISEGTDHYRPIIRYREVPAYTRDSHRPASSVVPAQVAAVSTGGQHGVTIYPNWDKFRELLSGVERDESDTDDIRIVTMAFTRDEKPADKFVELAKRDLRIKVMLTDPDSSEWLVRIRNRNRHRHDGETEEDALNSLRSQIVDFRHSCAQVKNLQEADGYTGSFNLYLSDLMPYGFAALTSRFIILGLFIATGSYGAGPMIVVETASNRSLAEALRKDWDDRLAHALGQHSTSGPQPRNPSSGIISDAHFMTNLEAKVPDGTTDIWVAAPDLANVGDSRSPFSELVRKIVRQNAGRGVNYTYICPIGEAGNARIESVRACFTGTSGKLRLYQVPTERFREITLVATHFITLNPNSETPDAYMQLPVEQSQKGWIKLNPNDARNIVGKMRHLIAECSTSSASA